MYEDSEWLGRVQHVVTIGVLGLFLMFDTCITTGAYGSGEVVYFVKLFISNKYIMLQHLTWHPLGASRAAAKSTVRSETRRCERSPEEAEPNRPPDEQANSWSKCRQQYEWQK